MGLRLSIKNDFACDFGYMQNNTLMLEKATCKVLGIKNSTSLLKSDFKTHRFENVQQTFLQ